MLVIRRTKPGVPAYWVLPGGGVEPGDESREAALHREIHEEIAGKADIIRLLHTTESGEERQLFYLARITTWSFDDRTGPEFSAEGRGAYALEEIPLTVEGLDGIDLRPEEIAHVLRGAISTGSLADER
ncbi:NUDIX domain-containing protein [Streptomyces sp. NPDC091201]|uniref:NUDIX hydrolase n=1 Tax=Streptomyces sp. NPDC091201 TaxID=3155190 RepID=UPI00343B300E